MSLTFLTGPFASPDGAFDFGALPERVRYWEPWPRRMRAVVAGETVLDSRRGVVFYETGGFPQHYFPLEDVTQGSLEPFAEQRDGRQRWSLNVRERHVENCVTAGPVDENGKDLLGGYVMLDFRAADRWFEEDDPIYARPRDPYHRVDVRSSSCHVVVRHHGQVIADSERPKLLFETGLPIRYYLPFADVHIDLFRKSDTVSECPYKGDGQHWHLIADGQTVTDAGWSLPHPLPEGLAASEHICFYPNKVEVEVDGARITD
jgi:uncharacterized protein (DUF427 family)